MDQMFNFLEKYMKLTEADKKIITGSNSVKKFNKNEIIKSAFAESEESFFVLSGIVYTNFGTEDKLIVGDFFFEGDPVLIPPSEEANICSYELRCIEPTILAVSNDIETEKLIRELPNFERVCRLFAEETLMDKIKISDQFKVLSPLEKYSFISNHRPNIISKVPQHLLASYLGIAPETLSRVRKKFLEEVDLNQ